MKTDKSFKDILKTMGENIEEERLQKKISIKEMAFMLQVDYSTYRNIEKGKSDTNITKLLHITEILQVPITRILSGIDSSDLNA